MYNQIYFRLHKLSKIILLNVLSENQIPNNL